MIDCLPLDDVCHISAAYHEMVVDAAYDLAVNERSFYLGDFNGRRCTYTWIDGTPAILIERDGEDVPDVLMGDGI